MVEFLIESWSEHIPQYIATQPLLGIIYGVLYLFAGITSMFVIKKVFPDCNTDPADTVLCTMIWPLMMVGTVGCGVCKFICWIHYDETRKKDKKLPRTYV